MRQCIKCGAVYPFPISRCHYCNGPVFFTDKKVVPTRQTAQQLLRENVVTSIVPGFSFLGSLPDTWMMLVSGPAGQGKSTFCLQLSQSLAMRGTVLYWSYEEGFGPSMQIKLRMNGIGARNLIFASSPTFKEFLQECHDVKPCAIVIDSLNDAGLDTRAVKKIKSELNCIGIFIAHYTKDRRYKGNSSLLHEIDIFVEIINGEAKTEKNRFDSIHKTMRVWAESTPEKQEKENGKSDSGAKPSCPSTTIGSDTNSAGDIKPNSPDIEQE